MYNFLMRLHVSRKHHPWPHAAAAAAAVPSGSPMGDASITAGPPADNGSSIAAAAAAAAKRLPQAPVTTSATFLSGRGEPAKLPLSTRLGALLPPPRLVACGLQLLASLLYVSLYVWSTYIPASPGGLRHLLDLGLCCFFAAELTARVSGWNPYVGRVGGSCYALLCVNERIWLSKTSRNV